MNPIKLSALALAAAVATITLTSVAAANDNAYRVPVADPPAPTRVLVRNKLAKLRAVQVKRLAAYSTKGVFPVNNVTGGMINIFKDDSGNLCAAANLIALDGNRALVDKTDRANNFIRLINVKKGELYDWMLTSGLTIDEIDRIQEPYMGDFDRPTEPSPTVIAAERQRLKDHFTRVLAELDRNSAASLDAATDKVMSRPDLIAKLLR